MKKVILGTIAGCDVLRDRIRVRAKTAMVLGQCRALHTRPARYGGGGVTATAWLARVEWLPRMSWPTLQLAMVSGVVAR